jgi:REP element-mobilizing transposase RayT
MGNVRVQRIIKRRRGAYLPHWTIEGAWYAVTFRLWDSIPVGVLNSWRFERRNIIRTAELMKRPLSVKEEQRLAYLQSERIEHYLDQGIGSCYMNDHRVAKVVADALTHFEGQRYDLAAWCVMPNHVHVVFKPAFGHELSNILHSWKSYTAKEANKILKRQGAFWQTEPYDHLIRNEAEFYRAVRYVLNNPAKAGLDNWQWVGRGKLINWRF